MRIASHFGFALREAFRQFPDAPGLIILEDDLLFSPDLYEYFHTVAPLLEFDQTTFVVSAWNDNGFKEHVQDKSALLRTEFFPGLGWLLTRKLFEEELRDQWPREHWDHWMRNQLRHKNRDCIVPQVPRDFHNGVQGSFMDASLHARYFADVAYSRDDSFRWPDFDLDDDATVPAAVWAERAVYEARLRDLLGECAHVQSAADLLEEKAALLCVWVDLDPLHEPPFFEPLSKFFHLWHEVRRGMFRGVHEFYFHTNYVVLVNVHGAQQPYLADLATASMFAPLRPSDAPILQAFEFTNPPPPPPPQEHKGGMSGASLLVGERGASCDATCGAVGKRCDGSRFREINTCEVMRRSFGGCTSGCQLSFGFEQPAQDTTSSLCLISSSPEESQCGASHAVTRRLCACA